MLAAAPAAAAAIAVISAIVSAPDASDPWLFPDPSRLLVLGPCKPFVVLNGIFQVLSRNVASVSLKSCLIFNPSRLFTS